MPFVFSIKDTYRQAVEAATGGRNTVMYDDKGNPSVMVAVPKFSLSDVLDGAPNVVCPAFLVNGVEKDVLWISKYLNIVHDNRAYSVPGVDPRASIDFNTARAACFAKGSGWHLMTNAECAAIALWCLKNGFQPRGNDNYGKSSQAAYESGVAATKSGGQINRTLTGSGPATWNHDGTPEGIADLRGNITEWVDGLKLVEGKIYVHQDNNFTTGNTEGSVAGWADTGRYFDVVGGNLVLNSVKTTAGTPNREFKALTAADGVTVPDLLRRLAIFPPAVVSAIAGDRVYVDNSLERLPLRGGYWLNTSLAGLFFLILRHVRSNVGTSIGFRAAFCNL